MILQQFRWGPGRQAQLLSSVFSEPRSRYRYVTQIALGDGTNCSGEARDLQKCNEDRGFHVMKRGRKWWRRQKNHGILVKMKSLS